MQDDNGQGIDLRQLLLDLSALLTALRKNFLDFGNIVQPIGEGLNEPRDPCALLGEYAQSAPQATERLTGTDRAGQSAPVDTSALISKADRSFSELPFDTDRNDAVDLLQVEVANEVCDHDPGCEWLIASAPHVRHAFDEEGRVTSKHIIIDDYGYGAVRALGIGNAKLKEGVVDAVMAFLPGIEVTCLSIGEAGEGPGRSSCGAMIGEANIKLIFADTDVLAEVHMYRYSGI